MIKPKSSYYQLPFLGGFPHQLDVCSWILSCSYGLATEESRNLHSFCLQVPKALNDTHSTNIFSCLKSKVGIGSFHYVHIESYVLIILYILFCHTSKLDPQIHVPPTKGTRGTRLAFQMSTTSDWYQRLVRHLWVPMFSLQSWVPCHLPQPRKPRWNGETMEDMLMFSRRVNVNGTNQRWFTVVEMEGQLSGQQILLAVKTQHL